MSTYKAEIMERLKHEHIVQFFKGHNGGSTTNLIITAMARINQNVELVGTAATMGLGDYIIHRSNEL